MKDEELVQKAEKILDKLIETGGKSWVLQIPPDENNCPDLVFKALIDRFKTYMKVEIEIDQKGTVLTRRK